ncbi:MAG: clostripain-related cysteine peptidase, partial [Roseiflexaceae bacterium]
AFNQGYGVRILPCTGDHIGNTITMNSIYSNTLGGIQTECPIAPPTIRVTAVGATDTVTGTTFVGARVEVFSDDDGQGRVYEGAALANSSGKFSFSKSGGFAGPNITATSTNAAGDTSAFSQPSHLLWTVLLYLNGDNDLSKAMSRTFDTVVKAGASPYANVLALVDGTSTSDTTLYDVTHGQSIKLSGTIVVTASGERNMGDGKTLSDFVTWGRAYYPAHHTLLAIVDHGGGWAPSFVDPISDTLIRRGAYLAGGSGLSWDFSSNYDYLDSRKIRQAMARITANGTTKLDVVFYDVCLMGMVEVAYQLKDYARYFVSSQNIGWAPDGPEGRYKRMLQRIDPTTTPSAMAQLLVNSYAQSMPLERHPYTISAIDMAALPALTSALNSLSTAISTTLKITPAKVSLLKAAYLDSQKVDYDGDFQIEPATDGFVDIYDFARHVALRFSDQPIKDAANVVMTRLSAAVVAEQHKSENPWPFPSHIWNLDNARGLSIFLPLGEDLEFVVTQTQVLASRPVTKTIHLRDMYSCSELQFVCASSWRGLVDTYYRVSASPIPTSTHSTPIEGLSGILPVDITPPTSTIRVSGNVFTAGTPITITWTITDTQLDTSGNIIAGSGVVNATLWYRPFGLDWRPVPASTQANNPGKFVFTPPVRCIVGLAVLGRDKVGNLEPPDHGPNRANVFIKPCLVRLPIVRR